MDYNPDKIESVTVAPPDIPNLRRYSHKAMAAGFEVLIIHEDGDYASQAANAAFDELDRLESELSRYIENSDISRINNLKPNEKIVVGPEAFEMLQISLEMYNATNHAFDITAGALYDCWLDKDRNLRKPTIDELSNAAKNTGSDKIILDDASFSVTVTTSLTLDPGAIGKGYAIDKMAELLEEWEIERFLIHGGRSTALAGKAPEKANGWHITISDPENRNHILKNLMLSEMAVSASGLEKGSHIIDPRSNTPAATNFAAWSLTKSAAKADAYSTAFMINTADEIQKLYEINKDFSAMIMRTVDEIEQAGSKHQKRVITFGDWPVKLPKISS
jgi:thiamine biosynthesis lipoprotein